jgi:hypothetical protein
MKLWRIILQWLKQGAPKAISTVPAQPAQAQTLWPAVAVDWMKHGGKEADKAMRRAAWEQAREHGIDALRYTLRHTDNYHLVMFLFEHEHNSEYRFREDNETRKAKAGGIRRWVVDVAPGTSAEWVADLLRAYGAGSDYQVQIVMPTPELTQALGLDSNGIKTTPAARRKR